EVAALVKLRRLQPRPAAVNFLPVYGAAKDKHHVRMTMIGASVSVFAHSAAELRHGDDDGVFSEIAKVYPKSSEGLREVAQHIGDLAFRAAFIDVVIPATYVRKRDLHTQIGLD